MYPAVKYKAGSGDPSLPDNGDIGRKPLSAKLVKFPKKNVQGRYETGISGDLLYKRTFVSCTDPGYPGIIKGRQYLAEPSEKRTGTG